MEKKIEDYANLYLGCDVITPDGKAKFITIGILGLLGCGMNPGFKEFVPEEIKLVLRSLSEITPVEVAELIGASSLAIEKANYESPFFQIQYRDENNEQQYKHAYLNQLNPDQFVFLLSKHFDLFNLIPAGIAINKETLNL